MGRPDPAAHDARQPKKGGSDCGPPKRDDKPTLAGAAHRDLRWLAVSSEPTRHDIWRTGYEAGQRHAEVANKAADDARWQAKRITRACHKVEATDLQRRVAQYFASPGHRYRGVAALADRLKVGKRAVQYALRAWEAVGVLNVVGGLDGNRPGRVGEPTEYKFDLARLEEMATHGEVLPGLKGTARVHRKGAARVHRKGALKGAPDEAAKGAPQGCTEGCTQGCTGCTPLKSDPVAPSGARPEACPSGGPVACPDQGDANGTAGVSTAVSTAVPAGVSPGRKVGAGESLPGDDPALARLPSRSDLIPPAPEQGDPGPVRWPDDAEALEALADGWLGPWLDVPADGETMPAPMDHEPDPWAAPAPKDTPRPHLAALGAMHRRRAV